MEKCHAIRFTNGGYDDPDAGCGISLRASLGGCSRSEHGDSQAVRAKAPWDYWQREKQINQEFSETPWPEGERVGAAQRPLLVGRMERDRRTRDYQEWYDDQTTGVSYVWLASTHADRHHAS